MGGPEPGSPGEAFDPREYWEERLGERFDLEGVGYLQLGRPYNRWLYRVRRAAFRKAVRRSGLDTSTARVLDIGSGTGFYLDRWLELGAQEPVGCDLTEVAVEELRERYPELYIHQFDVGGELEELEGEQFDAISCMDVLFHVVDDGAYARAFRNVASLLAPGGVFFLSDGLLEGATQREQHVVWRSGDEVQAAVRTAGLQVVERRPLFYLMNEPFDGGGRCHWAVWRAVARIAARSAAAGGAVGAALYPLERLLTAMARRSPSTEMVTCREESW